MPNRLAIPLLLTALTIACWGCSSAQTCAELRQSYQATLKAQQHAQPGDAHSGDALNLMATQLHEDTVGALIEQAIEQKGTLSHKVKRALPGLAKLELEITWTRLAFALTSECDNCIQVTSGLSARAKITAAGMAVSDQKARGKLVGLLPLQLTSTKGNSRLSTDLRKMTLKTIKLAIPGLPREFSSLIDPLARDAVHSALSHFGDTITLARWKPIALPGGKITIHARELAVFAPQKTIWIGWGAAVPVAPGTPGLIPRASLNSTDAAAISFAGPAMTALMRAMQGSGAVPSRLNQDLKPDKEGDVYITLTRVTPKDNGLDTAFTAWNLPKEGTCYQLDLEARANFDITPPKADALTQKARQGELEVKLDDVRVIKTSGDDTMIRLGLWLRSLFVEETMQAQTRLLATHDFEVGDGKLDVAFQRAETGDDAITLYLKPSWTPSN